MIHQSHIIRQPGFQAACLGLLALGVLPFVAGCSQDSVADSVEGRAASAPHVLEVNAVPITLGKAEMTLDLVGSMVPAYVSVIAAEVDGTIEAFCPSTRSVYRTDDQGGREEINLPLDIGHEMKKGQVVCRIDPTDYQLALEAADAELTLAKSNLDELRAWRRSEEIAQLEAQYEEAVALHERAQADLERSNRLTEGRFAPEAEHDGYVAQEKGTAATVKRTKAALDLAKAGPTKEQVAVAEARVKQAEVQVRLRQDDLEKCTIRAPYDAILIDRFLGVGDRVIGTPPTDIMRIINPDGLFARVSVPERFQAMVRVDNPASIQVPGRREPVPGLVDLVNEKIDQQTRSFEIRIAVDNRKRLFKAGSFVNVALPVMSASDVLVVPKSAIVMHEGRPSVFVVREDRVERRWLTLGIGGKHAWEVVEGIEHGDRVVVDRVSMLDDGMRVKVVDRAAKGQSDKGAK